MVQHLPRFLSGSAILSFTEMYGRGDFAIATLYPRKRLRNTKRTNCRCVANTTKYYTTQDVLAHTKSVSESKEKTIRPFGPSVYLSILSVRS